MKNRTRRLALLAAGAGVALVPLAGATPAGASSNEKDTQAAVTYVNYSGVTVTCTVYNYTNHNTDNPNQPTASVTSGLSGTALECYNDALLTLTVDYKDKSGVARESSASGYQVGHLNVKGTYSAITTSVNAYYIDCDATRSATCEATAIAHPK